jgi:hypothetical protein
VVGHLLALVPGDGAGPLAGQATDRLPHRLLDQTGVAAGGQVQQHDVAGGPLDQRADTWLESSDEAPRRRDIAAHACEGQDITDMDPTVD